MRKLFLSLLCLLTLNFVSCSTDTNSNESLTYQKNGEETFEQVFDIDLDKVATEYSIDASELSAIRDQLLESEIINFTYESYVTAPRQPKCQHGTPKMGHKVYDVGLSFAFVYTWVTVDGHTSGSWSISTTPMNILCPY